MTTWLADQLTDSQRRIDALRRKPRAGAPRLDAVYELAAADVRRMHDSVGMPAGSSTTLRAALGSALGRYNEASGGAIFAAAADLLGSTSVDLCAGSCASGYYNTRSNPDARLMSVGGICEDAISGFCGGLSTGGRHLGVASSYGAFIAPLGHVAARLHAIGAQARRETTGRAYDPIILICAHAGLKTGEDGPTHADPQPLQLLQENFPAGAMITLTPWDPREVPLLLAAALSARPAVIAPFVTRPNEIVLDRDRMGLASATEAHKGVYRLVDGGSGADVVLVLQGSEVTYEFIERALPRLRADGLRPDVYYVASAELFDRLDSQERESVFPSEKAAVAMGITGFTLPTMYRWIRSSAGIAATIHPYRKGRYLGSGHGRFVLQEAGLDGETQYLAIRQYLARAA
jgi:transketolase